jgi:hypothetical protein
MKKNNSNPYQRIIQSLLNSRDFLGHQLSHAQGLIDDEEYLKLENYYFNLVRNDRKEKDVFSEILILFKILGEDIDSDIVSESCSISLEKASSLLEKFANLINENSVNA